MRVLILCGALAAALLAPVASHAESRHDLPIIALADASPPVISLQVAQEVLSFERALLGVDQSALPAVHLLSRDVKAPEVPGVISWGRRTLPTPTERKLLRWRTAHVLSPSWRAAIVFSSSLGCSPRLSV